MKDQPVITPEERAFFIETLTEFEGQVKADKAEWFRATRRAQRLLGDIQKKKALCSAIRKQIGVGQDEFTPSWETKND